jgi:hypothetical protein
VRIRSQCPARYCSAGNPRQIEMNPEILTKAGVTGAWLSRAHSCTYCDAVYSLEGGRKVVRGWYGSQGWKGTGDAQGS